MSGITPFNAPCTGINQPGHGAFAPHAGFPVPGITLRSASRISE